MKGALAVMIELGLAGIPYGLLFFGREELPADESALRPLLARARGEVDAELVLMMEPTDNAIHLAATAIAELARHEPEPHEFDGLVFREVASVTKIAGGIASNVIPGEAEALVNFRYAPGRTPEEAEARLRELCSAGGELQIRSNSPSGPVTTANPHAR